jgi:hypothetical protein
VGGLRLPIRVETRRDRSHNDKPSPEKPPPEKPARPRTGTSRRRAP